MFVSRLGASLNAINAADEHCKPEEMPLSCAASGGRAHFLALIEWLIAPGYFLGDRAVQYIFCGLRSAVCGWGCEAGSTKLNSAVTEI